ncbi:MAG: outer membrane beta-barrel domain-containing protein [Deltaproteobacteria bacterium]|nr:outer membrane beta-barrel domain-containing protein [Deltaproteobacteria bacterium]
MITSRQAQTPQSVRAALTGAVLLCALLAPGGVHALSNPLAGYDDEEAAYKADVVQSRRFGKLHEFSLSGGVFPGDALYVGFAGTFRYTLHLSDLWAWEIAGGTYSFDLSTGAEKRMLDRYALKFTDTERLLVLAESNVMVKPIYGKFTVFNRWIWYAEPYLLAGAAITRYTASWRVGPDVGAGVRFHLFDWLALHLDGRYYMLWSGLPARPTSPADLLTGPSTLTNVYYLGAGVSFLVWDRSP